MKRWPLLAITTSALILSACSTGKDAAETSEAAPTAAPQAQTAAVSPSAQEEKEIAALMGDKKDDPAAPPAAEMTESAVSSEVSSSSTDPLPPSSREPVLAAGGPTNKQVGPGEPDGCPSVEVLPDTQSITYFEDEDGVQSTHMIARAVLDDIRGGCAYDDNGVTVDIDMVMKGKITDRGRFEGRNDLEAFMTFPYFIAVMDPEGKMIDKKIMATAMRFRPLVDDLDHAEKITQAIPLANISKGSAYTITVGFQLNRQQLTYNRGMSLQNLMVNKDSGKAKLPDAKSQDTTRQTRAATADRAGKASESKTEEKTEAMPPLKTEAKPEKDFATKAESGTTSTSAATPAPAESSGGKMKPIIE